ARARAPRTGGGGEVTGVVPPTAARPAGGALVPAESMPTAAEVEWRRSRAHAIVERHSTYSAVGGIIPLPIINVASVTAVILRMVKALSELYGVPFERDRAGAAGGAVMGGAAAGGLASAAPSTPPHVIPGGKLVRPARSSGC